MYQSMFMNLSLKESIEMLGWVRFKNLNQVFIGYFLHDYQFY